MLYCDHHLITEKHKGFLKNVKLSQDSAPLTSTATKSSTEYPGTLLYDASLVPRP